MEVPIVLYKMIFPEERIFALIGRALRAWMAGLRVFLLAEYSNVALQGVELGKLLSAEAFEWTRVADNEVLSCME